MYLGSVIAANGSDLPDVERRIALANSAFTSLSRVWVDSSLSITLRVNLYTVRVTSVLLYGCESWRLTTEVKMKLRGFHGSCLGRIYGRTTVEILRGANVPCIIRLAEKRRRLWLGHILRMPEDRVVKQVFNSCTPNHPPYPPWSLMAGLQVTRSEAAEMARDPVEWLRKIC